MSTNTECIEKSFLSSLEWFFGTINELSLIIPKDILIIKKQIELLELQIDGK